TRFGGAQNNGTVYSLAGGGGWSESVLHSFSGDSDGAQPLGLLVQERTTGSLYGTASAGGDFGCGTAFQLAQSNGNWSYSTLYFFRGGADGCTPFPQLRPGPKPGVFVGGTTFGNGTLFQLKQSNGVWSESTIYTFTGGSDGAKPYDLDASGDGTIYGVAHVGGATNKGVVFELVPHRKK